MRNKNKKYFFSAIYLTSVLAIAPFLLTACKKSQKEIIIDEKMINNDSTLITINENEIKNLDLEKITMKDIKFQNFDNTKYEIEVENFIKENKTRSLIIKYRLLTKNKKIKSQLRTIEINKIGINKQFLNSLLLDQNTIFELIDFLEETGNFSTIYTEEFLEPKNLGQFGIKLRNEKMFVPEDLIVDYKFNFDDQNFDGYLNLNMNIKLDENVSSDTFFKKIKSNLRPGLSLNYLFKNKKIDFQFLDAKNYSLKNFPVNQIISNEFKEKFFFTLNNDKNQATSLLNKYNLVIKKIIPSNFNIEEKSIAFDVFFEENNKFIQDEEKNLKIKFVIKGFNNDLLLSEEEFQNFINKLIIENRFFEEEIINDAKIINNANLYYSENGVIDENSIIVNDEFLNSKYIKYFNRDNLFEVEYDNLTKNISAKINIFRDQNNNKQKIIKNKILNKKITDINWEDIVKITLRNNAKNKEINKIKVNDFLFSPKRDDLIQGFDFITVWSISLENKKLESEQKLMNENKRTIKFTFKNKISQKLYEFKKIFEFKK